MLPLLPVQQPVRTRLRVLIVEDESLVALDLEERLGRLGYEVAGVVDNGTDALRLALTANVELILMDIHIRGDMDGIEAAGNLREIADVPVVFLTAHADESTLQRAGLTEPFGYVLKPFDERELRATVQMAHYRHRAESRLRKMERWLTTTLRSIGDGVIATDSDGRITFINAMAEAVSGWTRGAAVGRHLAEVFAIVTPDGIGETNAILHRAMTDGLVITLGEGRCLRTRDGRLVPVDDSLAPIRDDHGRITGCVIIFRDNTANLEAEKERRQLQVKMQEAQRLESLGVLAGGIAHDFNNLLVAVTCNASLGQTMVPGESPAMLCFQDIERAADRAAQLCNQMMAYAGKGQSAPREMDLSAFTRDSAKLLQIAIHKGATLKLDLADGLPPFLADPSQLQQIVMNLVINASEALDEKGGKLTVRTSLFNATRAFLAACRAGADLGEGDYVMLEVSDTGHGIEPDVLARIFDPFFTTKSTGRGLGLAAISGIIRSHGGALAVESTPGAGTTFRVLFPALKTTAAEAAPVIPPAGWRGSGRALLIDDEDTVRLAVGAVLRHLGFEVELAANGEEGIAKATAPGDSYRVVLLDLTMPKPDGPAVLAAIHAQRPSQHVLLMSGYTNLMAAQILADSGHVAFVKKPFSIPDLTEALRALLGA